ncbi:MAG TPA: cytochrome P450 [Bryobacteraceae bacterium]
MKTRDKFFEPLDPQVLSNPYPSYRRLREAHPVYWHEQLQSWVLTRYADCVTVLNNSDLFAADFRRIGIPTPAPLLSLQTLDPPEQNQLRNFAINAVRAQDFDALERDAHVRADRLMEALATREQIDFLAELTGPFTLGTICRLLGVEPPEQDETWARLNDDLHRSMDAQLAPDSEQAGLDARAAFTALVGRWLTGNVSPGIVEYIKNNIQAAGVSQDVLLNSVRAFWHAGFEVPSRFLCNAMLALVQNGALRELAKSASLDQAIEELLRYAAPVHAVSRACTEDTKLGSQSIRRGDIVIVMIAAANRDPELFERPDELVLDRTPNPHIGFGRGAHACLGGHIARMEARVVFSRVAWQFKDAELAAQPDPRPNATLHGPAHLMLRLKKVAVAEAALA